VSQPRALVSQPRFPEIDRDTGSQRVDLFMKWLQERGWSVTFLATEDDSELRHGQRLRELGIPAYVGIDEVESIVSAGTQFDLALLAFWWPASRLLPILRTVSPETRVIVDSIDVHFLREARRRLLMGAGVDEEFGAALVSELSAYQTADAVLTVSSDEARFLGDFLGPERIHEMPLAHTGRRSPVPFERRHGILFVGNFRHLPNGEAVEYLCGDVVPRLAPDLLTEHPVYVVGNRLDFSVAKHARGLQKVAMVGWVPSVAPYVETARINVVPLLHGAGVKGKVVESLMAGTPVVTTTIGAEGLDLKHGEHVLIADTTAEFADAITHLLTDHAHWEHLVQAGYEHVAARHAPERVAERFDEVLESVLDSPPRSLSADVPRPGKSGGREPSYHETRFAITAALHALTALGSSVLVVSNGDDSLLSCAGRRLEHFPQGPDGEWSGFHPGHGATAIEELEALRERGARYFVVPSFQFWWLHHYPDLAAHLESTYRRIFYDDNLIVFDLAPEPRPVRRSQAPTDRRERVLVSGTFDDTRSAPPAHLLEELDRAERFEVHQHWQPAGTERTDAGGAEADWILHVDGTAVLPTGFVDDFLGVLTELAALGVERAQPAHMCGPEAGPPCTERLMGVLARELEGPTPMPVTVSRPGVPLDGPTALVDAVPIALNGPIHSSSDPLAYSRVLDIFVDHDEGPRRGVSRRIGAAPRISVLLATYERPELLAACLEGFCHQTLPASEFEVVVVDDGSIGVETQQVLADYASRLPLTSTRMDHAGRAAAKNLALLLARGELVLLFDDDDSPAPDLLAEHIRAHARHPEVSTAVLGHTDWDPLLEISPLMHYLTEVDRLLFAYPNFRPGQRIDWRGFWEGRVSSKRSLHIRHGLHDQRLDYLIDVELSWRLRDQGLHVIYHPAARSVQSRPVDFEGFCRHYEAKGRAQATIASIHDDPEIREYTRVDGAAARWEAVRPQLPRLKARIAELEQVLAEGEESADEKTAALAELHQCYREVFFAHNAKGITDVLGDTAQTSPDPASSNGNAVHAPETNGHDSGDEPPQLSIVIPVWSRTSELAEMAAQTLDRVWEVARLRTEVIVIDNGSPFERSLPARVHRFPENRGVATAWNAGIHLARAPVIAVINSDCVVEPGWDVALYEAATTGRRIAFPYTDHCDGEGFRRPDQAGTAGWCYMLTRELYTEIGHFDEWFNPAYGEDTDYWHRAWELGIELSPVPAARVTHARRTSMGEEGSEMLLLGHRYKYGWKHGVDPLKAPPYYNREIVEYHGTETDSSRTAT
jgi:glycosyltransferase involved in cell wall biosynthesis